jgi:hypothetical protein
VHFDIAVGQLPRHHPRIQVIALEIELIEAKGAEISDPDAVVVNNDVKRQREAGKRIHKVEFREVGSRPEYVDAAA